MNASSSDSDASDAELVRRSQAGEPKAFAALVTRHQAAACSVAFSVCGDLSSSEDIAQEAFVSAWKQLRQIREAERFRSWLCGIARKIALSQIRRRDRRGEGVSTESLPETPDASASPSETVILAEESALLWQTLLSLPEHYREPLVLFYREHQSIDAVASALEISQDAVKQRLSRGRALLREELANRIETALGQTRPGGAFTASVVSALPTLSAGIGSGAATSSAKATGAGAALGATIASSAVGLFGLYTLARYMRASSAPKAARRIAAQTAILCLLASTAYAVAIGWIAANRGEVLISRNLPPAIVAAGATALFAAALAAFAIRASKLIGRLDISPNSLNAPARRYASKWRIAGLPLVSVAFGADLDNCERIGVARGWIAIGDIAFGGISIGIVACGPIAIGGVCGGLISVGGCAVGFLAIGGLAIGQAACGSIALAWHIAIGGVSIAKGFAIGTLAIASEQAAGLVAIAPVVNNAAAAIQNGVWADWAEELVPHLGWLSLLSLPVMLVALRRINRF